MHDGNANFEKYKALIGTTLTCPECGETFAFNGGRALDGPCRDGRFYCLFSRDDDFYQCCGCSTMPPDAREVWVAPRAGDVLLTSRNDSWSARWFARLIERMTWDDAVPTFSHALLVVSQTEGIEAVASGVRRVPLAFYTQAGRARWVLLRFPRLTAQQAGVMVSEAERMLGRWYAYGKLWLHFLDRLFGTRWFTRALGMERYPICSVLVARCAKVAAGIYVKDDRTGKNLTVDSVAPDDLWDHARCWPEELVEVTEWNGHAA